MFVSFKTFGLFTVIKDVVSHFKMLILLLNSLIFMCFNFRFTPIMYSAVTRVIQKQRSLFSTRYK